MPIPSLRPYPIPKPAWSPISVFLPKISLIVNPKESNYKPTSPLLSKNPKMSPNGMANVPKMSPNGVIYPIMSQWNSNAKMSPGVLITPKVSFHEKTEVPKKSPIIMNPKVSSNFHPKISTRYPQPTPIKSMFSIVGSGVKPIESVSPSKTPKISIHPIVNSIPSPKPINHQYESPRPSISRNPQVSKGTNQINAHTSPKYSAKSIKIPNSVISPKKSPLNSFPTNPILVKSPIPSIGSKTTVKDPITTKPKDPVDTTIANDPKTQKPLSGNSPSPAISAKMSIKTKSSPILASAGNPLSWSIGLLVLVVSILLI
jgi:hypothetical protein